MKEQSGKQTGRGGNVYYMRMHLLAGGSALLEGDCFSISLRQSSKTWAIERKRRGSDPVRREQQTEDD